MVQGVLETLAVLDLSHRAANGDTLGPLPCPGLVVFLF